MFFVKDVRFLSFFKVGWSIFEENKLIIILREVLVLIFFFDGLGFVDKIIIILIDMRLKFSFYKIEKLGLNNVRYI